MVSAVSISRYHGLYSSSSSTLSRLIQQQQQHTITSYTAAAAAAHYHDLYNSNSSTLSRPIQQQQHTITTYITAAAAHYDELSTSNIRSVLTMQLMHAFIILTIRAEKYLTTGYFLLQKCIKHHTTTLFIILVKVNFTSL